ncbi:hypothetical protein Cob_v009586 [Colletotrichum orbiculare MAFF 240422]|uniref:Clr5 domain-containing protein n=1 Tax=Colletotrichum orbiculare (strain 104-T / ATCC 96160 / CBS 514.97 / LARS 414 / MAFF 240422) TaxID=1213857 RepID=A0A484FG69_COLOR|nr:hypothetical protein Cob_v009586 [Colletotrichum orbiculare MAFF 240422]
MSAESDWEAWREDITRLYLDENKSLAETAKYLKERYNAHVTPRMLKRKYPNSKHLRKDECRQLETYRIAQARKRYDGDGGVNSPGAASRLDIGVNTIALCPKVRTFETNDTGSHRNEKIAFEIRLKHAAVMHGNDSFSKR